MTPDRSPPPRKGQAADSLDAEAGRVFDAYLADLETGRPADPEGLVAAHPHLAERLRACLDVLRWTNRLAEFRGAEPGFILGDFRIVREIGRGGMGVVYEAEQLSLGRRVALKVLQASGAIDPRQFQRFQVEARAAACLHHAHVVPVFTTGSERGVYFYAMQYIEGQGLDSVIRDLRRLERLEDAEARDPAEGAPLRVEFPRGRGFFEAVARLGIQAAEALDHAHSLGIVHRDIKPANLLVDPDGALWVTDFGLARVQADGNLTVTGDLLGTPKYMSPEQVLNERGGIDHRSDIYSLGATLYEFLTLRPAHEGRDRAGLIRRIGVEEPKPPRVLNPAIPRDFETIVLKAMARDPEQRYASARDLADDLRRFLDDRPIRARRPGPWRRASRWMRRHRPAVISAVLALGVVGLAAGFVASQLGRSRRLTLAVQRAEYAKDVARAFQLVAHSELAEAARVLERQRPGRGEEDLRSFPWYYLRQVCRPPTRTLAGHTDSTLREVYHVEFSPASDLLASCGQDGTVRFWDPATGRLRRVLRGHEGDVNWVAFSPDGAKLGTGGDDGTVRLWDLSAGDNPAPVILGRHDKWVTCVLFTPDGQRLISAGLDGRVTVWDVRSHSRLRSFSAHREAIQGMAASPDGSTLATASDDHTVKLWNLDTSEEHVHRADHAKGVRSVAFSRSGQLLASVGFGLELRLWDAGSAETLAIGRGHIGIVECATFSPDDRIIATCGDDASIRLWDARTALPLQVFRADPDRLWCVAFSRDGRTLASCGNDGHVRLWDVEAAQDRVVLRLPVSRIDSIALPPGSDELMVAGPPEEGGKGQGRLAVSSWDLRPEIPPRARQRIPLRVRRIAESRDVLAGILSQDGKTLVARETGGTLRLWDLATGSPGYAVQLPEGGMFALAEFNTPLLLLTWVTHNNMEPVVWETGSRASRLRFRGDISGPGIASAIDGNSLVLANAYTMFRWDPAADRVTRVKQPHHAAGSWMNVLTISRDGEHLATGRADHSVQFWNARTLGWEATLLGHQATLISLDFSPDGRVLASASEDGVVKLWDVATRVELMTLEGVAGDAHSPRHLRFSPDGSALVYGFSDGKTGFAIIWPAAGDDANHASVRRERRFASGPYGMNG